MRRSAKSNGLTKRIDDSGTVDRSRLLQLAEQRSAGDAGQAAAPVEFLIAFARALIRAHPSPDCISLAMRSANRACQLTPDQEAKFRKAVDIEVDRSPWPKGFF